MDLYLLSIENLKQVYDIFDKKSKWISVVPNFLSDTLGLFLLLLFVSFFFFSFLAQPLACGSSLGQGLYLRHSSTLSYCCDITGSLTH